MFFGIPKRGQKQGGTVPEDGRGIKNYDFGFFIISHK
jgi:hypothetical protein